MTPEHVDEPPRPAPDAAKGHSVDDSLKPLPAWFVFLAVGVAVTISIPLTVLLLIIAGPDATRQIDAIRTGLTTAAGTGGLFALWLAFHRQRSSERIAENNRLASKRDHEQRERASEQSFQGETARRIIDQYAKAADQLGSDRAPVRLAALHALERIGDANESERHLVISLICSYLRMPFRPNDSASMDASTDMQSLESVRQELVVRTAAQEIVAAHMFKHLNSGLDDSKYWAGLSINLDDATLVNFSIDRGFVDNFSAKRARFVGPTNIWVLRAERIALTESVFEGAVTANWIECEYFNAAQCRFEDRLSITNWALRSSATFSGAQHTGDVKIVVKSPYGQPLRDLEQVEVASIRSVDNKGWISFAGYDESQIRRDFMFDQKEE